MIEVPQQIYAVDGAGQSARLRELLEDAIPTLKEIEELLPSGDVLAEPMGRLGVLLRGRLRGLPEQRHPR